MPIPLLKKELAIDLLQKHGVASGSSFAALGISRSYLYNLAESGEVMRVGRGLFSLPNQSVTIHHSLAEVAAYMPQAVICLASALQYHEIGTQMPPAVWVALNPHSYVRQHSPTAIQVIYMQDKYLKMGAETHVLEGVSVKITNIAKTIVDCFKHRRSVGLDVSLEALKDVLENRRVSVDEIYDMAAANRVSRIVHPYLEALQ